MGREFLISGTASIVTACGTMILARANDLHVIIKRQKQQTTEEQRHCGNGLRGAFFLELLVLVPISAAMVVFMIRPFLVNIGIIKNFIGSCFECRIGFDCVLGYVSYRFPFTRLRNLITERAMQIVKKFESNIEKTKEATASE